MVLFEGQVADDISYWAGMFERLLRFKGSEGSPRGLYFAGDYTEGGLIEGAARSGHKAAQRVMADRGSR